MRRFWIVPATLVLTVGLAATAATATAAAPAARANVSCSSLANRYSKVSSSASAINPSRPSSLSQLFTSVENSLKGLANNGPKSLRSAFRDLANLYAPLVHLNLTDPASLSRLEGFANNPRYLADLRRIAAYFSGQCHITIPTPTS